MTTHELDTVASIVGSIYLDTVLHFARASRLATVRVDPPRMPDLLAEEFLGAPARWCPELLRVELQCRFETVVTRGDRPSTGARPTSATPEGSARRWALCPVVDPLGHPMSHHLSLIADPGGRVEKRLNGRLFGALPLDRAYARTRGERALPRILRLLLSADDARALAQLR